jgi:hypothetical protein
MNLISKLKMRKYFRFDLDVNDGSGWKKYGDYKEFLDYKDIENPDPGCILKLYGVYKDLSRKEGYARKSLWEHSVPVPGGNVASANGKGSKKEKPIEERLMEKIMEGADFSGLKPAKLSLPFGKSGGTLDFEAPVTGSGDGGGAFIKIGDNRYPMGDVPPLEFEGKLPSWLHPAAGAMIMGMVDRFGTMIKGAIGGAITETTGIKAKNSIPAGNTVINTGVDEAPDAISELDDILNDDIEGVTTKEKEKVVNKKGSAGKSKGKGKTEGGK